MFRKIFLSLFIFISCCISACENLQEKGYDTKAISEEMKNREVKRVTEIQLKEWVVNNGDVCNTHLSQVIWQKLLKYPDSLQVKEFQSLRLSKIKDVDSLSKHYNIKVKKINLNLKDNNQLNDFEKNKLNYYKENYQKTRLKSEVQIMEYDTILYTAPIYLPNKELIGMWSLYFPRTSVIKMIEVE